MVKELVDLSIPADGPQDGVAPDPAQFASGRVGKKGRKKRHFEQKKGDISINSLLDVLSVLLVFLLKSYSSSNVQLKPDKDLQVPFTHSQEAPEESTAITLTLNKILVDEKPVLTLDNGKVPSQDQTHAGLLIEPLFNELQEAVGHQKQIAARNNQADFKGVITIIADRFVRAPLLTQVMYTAGQAEFSKFKFLLVKLERG